MRRLASCLAVLIVIGFIARLTYASPKSFVSGVYAKSSLAISKKDSNVVDAIFANDFSMKSFGRRCLKDYWEEFTKEEQTRFVELFSKLIKENVQKRLIKAQNKDYSLQAASKIENKGRLIKVTNELSYEDATINFTIILTQKGKGYDIVDYEIDGILLSRQYRSAFNRKIRREGKNAFFKMLEKKV